MVRAVYRARSDIDMECREDGAASFTTNWAWLEMGLVVWRHGLCRSLGGTRRKEFFLYEQHSNHTRTLSLHLLDRTRHEMIYGIYGMTTCRAGMAGMVRDGNTTCRYTKISRSLSIDPCLQRGLAAARGISHWLPLRLQYCCQAGCTDKHRQSPACSLVADAARITDR